MDKFSLTATESLPIDARKAWRIRLTRQDPNWEKRTVVQLTLAAEELRLLVTGARTRI